MANAGDVVINSLLCFISSAKNDYTKSVLLEVANSFYSHERIKEAKIEITTILNKDLIWRRDPDKKLKDLKDVLDFYDELEQSKLKKKFVSDSYKQMPPVGLEFVASVLTNLASEVAKINEVLPKIVDIKSEVLNTADTVREMAVNMKDLKDNFKNAVVGLQEASDEVSQRDELQLLQDIRSFRLSIGGDINDKPSANKDIDKNIAATSSEVGESVGVMNSIPIPNSSINKVQGATSGAIPKHHVSSRKSSSDEENNYELNFSVDSNEEDSRHQNGLKEPWNLVVSSRQKKKDRRQQQQQQLKAQVSQPSQRRSGNQHKPGGAGQQRRPSTTRIMGKRTEGHTFRAVKRTVDVFLGRVDPSVTVDDIKQYIGENFDINILNVDQLAIKSDRFVAFKITVNLNDRDALFNCDMWPEDVIIDKFYSHRSNRSDFK